MTQRDKWAKRPCVLRYRAWADAARLAAHGRNDKLTLDVVAAHVVAHFPIPRSFSFKKRSKLAGELHRDLPDGDNVLKGVLDSLLAQDKGAAVLSIEKRWCMLNEPPRTVVTLTVLEA
jgi:Endodeoxyribonuclease RusA